MKSRLFAFALAILGCADAFAQIEVPKAADNAPIDAATRKRVLNALEEKVSEIYIFPDMAKKVVLSLKQHEAKADYDKLTTAGEFATQVTRDMQAVAHDKHLGLSSVGPMKDPGSLTSAERESMQQTMREDLRAKNYDFHEVKRLPGNIGYLELRSFQNVNSGAGDIAAAAMTFLSNCDAVIFDLRNNRGGGPQMIDLLISYLYPLGQRVHLNDFLRRDKSVEQFWTSSWVPGKTLAGKDIYVLTSNRTFSAAEEFAYDIQALKRGTIVGEITRGGGNAGGMVHLGDNFAAFIPSQAARNPITKSNWDGVGVKPDVQVSAEDALKAASLLALRKMASNDAQPALQRERRDALADLEKELGEKVRPTKPGYD